MNLRQYQIDAINRTLACLDKTLLVAPTGSGKTVMAAEIINRTNGKILFLTHREEILRQAKKRFDNPNIIKSGMDEITGSRITVAQVQTLARRDLPQADLVVSDECAHIRGIQWETILSNYPNSKHLGLTATPYRLDGKGLGKIYTNVVEVSSIRQLQAEGWLATPEYYGAAIEPDTSKISKTGAEYNIGELSNECRRVEIVSGAKEIIHKNEHRKTIVFCVDKKHANTILENENWAYIDGDTQPEKRQEILEKFESGEIHVIVNINILIEGWDCPSADTVILARPTCSRALYMQMVGRIMRPKPDALVIDLGGNVHRHGFVEEEIKWNLEDGIIKKRKKESTSPHTCKNCLSIYKGNICHKCGIKREIKYAEIVERKQELQKIKIENMGLAELRIEYMKYCNWARKTNRTPGAAYGRFVNTFKRKPLYDWTREAGIIFINQKPTWKNYF